MPTPFEAFPLHPAVLDALEAADAGAPTPVQTHVIPLLMDGQDVVVHAGPHSGETLAYGLPVLSLFDPLGKPQAVILVPSAERAMRVYKKLAELAKGVLTIAPLYESSGAQLAAIRKGCDVVIGTPFLVKDLFTIKQLDLNNVRMIVLDGADRMLTTVQRRDCEYLLDRLPCLEQTALFTWNVTEGVEAVAHHLKSPAMVRLTPEAEAAPALAPAPAPAPKAPRSRTTKLTAPAEAAPAAEPVDPAVKRAQRSPRGTARLALPADVETHRYARVTGEQRADFLLAVIEAEAPKRAAVLCRNKHEARRLAQKLEKLGRAVVDNINADTAPAQRNAALARFRSGDLRYLLVPEQAAQTLDLGAPGHVYLTGVGDPAVYQRYSDACKATGEVLTSLTLVPPEGEKAFAAICETMKFARHSQDPGPAEEAPAAAAPAAVIEAEPEAKAAPAPRRARSGRTGVLVTPVAPRQSSAASLINEAHREERVTTGPLAPLPRLRQTWQTFKVTLAAGQRPSRDTFHGWLAQQTGIARSSLRSIEVHKGYATVDVEDKQVERFQQRLQGHLLG